MPIPEARAAFLNSAGVRARCETKSPPSFPPVGKQLIEGWPGSERALENPLRYLACCLTEPRCVYGLICSLSGKLGNLTEPVLPTDSGGKQEVTKETSHCLGVPSGHTAAQMHKQLGHGFFSFGVYGSSRRHFQRFTCREQRSAEMCLSCLRGVISC